MKNKSGYRCAIMLCSAALLPMLAAAADDDETRVRRMGEDLFMAGSDVRFSESVPGDALLAGGEVTSTGNVGGDAAIAGGRVRIGGTVGEDLYAAGGDLEIAANVSGSARLAGGQIEVTEDAVLGAGVSIGGGDIDIRGRIGSYANIGGGRVRIDGNIEGDVDVAGGELQVGPRAVINGNLTWRGPEPARVDPGAQIMGEVRNIEAEYADQDRARAVFRTAGLVWVAGWLIAGVVLLALLPGATRSVTDTVRARPWHSLLLGLALLAAVPVAMVIFAITLIGIPLALLLLLIWLLLLPLGYLAGVAAIGDWLLPQVRGAKPITTPIRIGMFIAALIVVYLVTLIPFLGGLVTVAVLLFGMGAVALAAVRRTRPPAPAV